MHENNEWIPPFEDAFKKLNLNYDFWYLPEMDLSLGYNPQAEHAANTSAPLKVAEYLQSLVDLKNLGS